MDGSKSPKVLSLFSGCGGLDLGFSWAGYDVVWANEIDSNAVETYKKNLGDHIQCSDINTLKAEDLPDVDIIIGGPPCQSFSLAGKRMQDDPRSNLVWNFLRIVATKKPQVFLMENVPGLKSGKDKDGKTILSQLIAEFSLLGYNVSTFILNAADYGVPQRRRRLFVIGNLEGLAIPSPPPTHAARIEDLLFDLALPWVSSGEAIDDLSSPSLDGSAVPYRFAPRCNYQEFMRKNNGGKVLNHQIPYMSETDMKIIMAVRPGGNYMDVPDEIATKRIMNFKKSGGRTTTYGRLHPEKASYTLNTYFSRPNVGCNIHFSEDRLITIREGLRLQSFPDDFVVYSTSKSGAYKQVGNAVPPLLGRAIAEEILAVLR